MNRPPLARYTCVLAALLLQAAAASAQSQFSVTGYQLVTTERISRTEFDYGYTVTIKNNGAAASGVTGKVSSGAPGTTVRQDSVAFGNIASGAFSTTTSTFLIRVDRSLPFDINNLKWTFSAAVNRPPVANAGPAQTVAPGQLVTLNGSASSDPDGNTLTYRWTLSSKPAGSAATLSSSTVVNPQFTADKPGEYTAQLIVNDGLLDSAASTVVVRTANSAPVANAGAGQTVGIGTTVQLSGAKSSDADGDTLTFRWTLPTRPAGSQAILTGANTMTPSFVADKSGTYIAQLIVNDGKVDSAPSNVTISTANTPPVANAGPDQTVQKGATVTLNGTASSDVDGNSLIYKWSFQSRPTGSNAALSSTSAPQPTFVADKAGTFVVQLIVNDGAVDSPADTVVISTSNTAPVANAGGDKSVTVGTLVTLNGSASSDANGDPLTYSWSLTAKPAGSNAQIANAPSSSASLPIDKPGSYAVQLIVNDGTVNSAPANAIITTINSAPVANAGPDQNVSVLNTVTLNGGSSTDADGDTLSYAWSLLSKPSRSSAQLTGATSVVSSFVADEPGTYVAQLIVNDGKLAGSPDTVTITVVNNNTLRLESSAAIVGVGRTVDGTVRLGNALATPVTVALSSSNSAYASVSPASVTIPAGQTTATFTIQGVGSGTATITGTAATFVDATLDVTSSINVISLASGVSVSIGQSSSLALNLSSPAPAGGVTVTLTSNDPAIATVTPSVFIPAGATLPANNPQITGVALGKAKITASAPNFAGDTREVTVTLALSFDSSFSVNVGATANATLKLSSPAPAGGVTVNLTMLNTALATVPASVTIAAGNTSVPVPVTGVATGTTTLKASAAGINEVTLSVRVDPAAKINMYALTVGKNLQASTTPTLSVNAPPGGVAMTITSGDPSKVLLSTSATAPGSASVTLNVPAGNTSGGAIYVQSLDSAGSVQLTATATGYTDAVSTITLARSGFYFNAYSNDFTTTTFSSNTVLNVNSVYLDGAGAAKEVQVLRAGFSATVEVTNSNDTTGTLTKVPLTFTGNANSAAFEFDPANAGNSTMNIVTPAGWTTPNSRQSVKATVTAPNINASDVSVGKDLQNSSNASLSQTPPTATSMTIKVNDPSIAAVSASNVVSGVASITLPNITTTGGQTYYIEGRSTGSTTVTLSAPGYNDKTITITVKPSGFAFDQYSDISTNTMANPTTSTVRAYMLRSTDLWPEAQQALRPGFPTVTVPVALGNTDVGSLSASSVNISAGQATATVQFTPLNAGSTTLAITQPSGFTTPGRFGSASVNVTAPAINIAPVSVGKNLQSSTGVALAQAPKQATDITLTIADPSIALISRSSTAVGGQTIVLPGVTTSGGTPIYFQGLEVGSTTLTVSAPGFVSKTVAVTVMPSGVYIKFPGTTLSTTTFAANSSITVAIAMLKANLTPEAEQILRPGAAPVTVQLQLSNQTVGSLTSDTVTLNAGESSKSGPQFDPAAAGTVNMTVSTPAGYTTPSSSTTTAITVTAPNINATNSLKIGRDLQVSTGISLGVAPPSPVTVTVTSNSPVVTVSSSPVTEGTSTVSFANVSGTSVGTFYVQGRAIGSTTLTIRAPGYNDATITVSVVPSGFVFDIYSQSVSTKFPADRKLTVVPVILDPNTLNSGEAQAIRGGLVVQVPVESQTPAVGIIDNSPLPVVSNESSKSANFHPIGLGTATVKLGTAAGFYTPSNNMTAVVTVTP